MNEKDAKQLKPIENEVNNMHKNIGFLTENISKLITQIEPILTPSGPDRPDNESKEEVLSGASGMTSSLSMMNNSLSSLIDLTHRTTKRVEI